MARVCFKCGNSYYRSNRFRMWTKRGGVWVKGDEPICTRETCCPPAKVQRIIVATQMRILPAKASKAS